MCNLCHPRCARRWLIQGPKSDGFRPAQERIPRNATDPQAVADHALDPVFALASERNIDVETLVFEKLTNLMPYQFFFELVRC